MTEIKVQRNEKGHWIKGGPSPNPTGEKKGIFSDAALKLIASFYLDQMPREKLFELLQDDAARGKLSTAHDIVLTRISEALRRDSEGRLNADWVMDRLIGKPVQQTNNSVDISGGIEHKHTFGLPEEAMDAMMRRYLSKKDRLITEEKK